MRGRFPMLNLSGAFAMQRNLINSLWGFLVVLLFAASSSAQSPAPAQDNDDAPIKLKTDLITLDAQITRAKNGEIVNGLTKDDFIITDEGVKQLITNFSQDTQPLSVLLLLDVSGSLQPVIDKVADEGMQALSQLRPDDDVAVVTFGKWATVSQKFTKDRQQVIKSIRFIKDMGEWIRAGTNFNEGVYTASEYMSQSANSYSRRVIIVITDNILGGDLEDLNDGHSEAEARAMLSQSNAVLCSLTVGKFADTVQYYKDRGRILKDSIGPYVSESGGLVSEIDKSDAVTKLTQLIERMRVRYTFGYVPTNMQPDGKFHKLRLSLAPNIEAREGKIDIKTRTGYYAPKPGSNSGSEPVNKKKSKH
jgi:VWFA-related protein